MATGQHAVHGGKSIPVQTCIRPQAVESIPVQNGIVRRAGKSILQTLLQGHQMTTGGLHFSTLQSNLQSNMTKDTSSMLTVEQTIYEIITMTSVEAVFQATQSNPYLCGYGFASTNFCWILIILFYF